MLEHDNGEHDLTPKSIKDLISSVTDDSNRCGFEVYIITKTEPRLKKMGFVEDGKDNNLRLKLKESILNVLSESYNSPDTDYVSSDYIADNQRKNYIISTSEDYDPFSVLRADAGIFSDNDIMDATGIAFSIRHGQDRIWAYQHLWSLNVPNKSKKNFWARLISRNEGQVFAEMTEPIIGFAKKIDLLVMNDCIITSNVSLMQNSFGFQDYIRNRAIQSIDKIEETGIVSNVDKLRDYVNRSNGKICYSKKLMRIADSRVLKMTPDNLWENIHKSSRWNGKIKEENGKFVLDTYKDVENLIDLLDERYTRSEITNTEYDTDVKKEADPISEDVNSQ